MNWHEDFELESRRIQFGMVEDIDMSEVSDEIENTELAEYLQYEK